MNKYLGLQLPIYIEIVRIIPKIALLCLLIQLKIVYIKKLK